MKIIVEKTVITTNEVKIESLDEIKGIEKTLPKDCKIKEILDDDGIPFMHTLCMDGEHRFQTVYYKPLCPRGYTDCILDPAKIKAVNPVWYKELYGDATPEEAIKECIKRVQEDPDEKYYCYDDEDK
jgi:hypothetical protein